MNYILANKQLPVCIPKGAWSAKGICGRHTAIAYICSRCGETLVVLETEEMRKRSEGNLQCYDPPEGWSDWYIPHKLFCPECTKKLEAFMKGDD